ncbi:penicillin-binding protein 1C [Campylobacter troglodytis]|nr:penicillin-binding protein 1C [Campylobacter troglodytis]
MDFKDFVRLKFTVWEKIYSLLKGLNFKKSVNFFKTFTLFCRKNYSKLKVKICSLLKSLNYKKSVNFSKKFTQIQAKIHGLKGVNFLKNFKFSFKLTLKNSLKLTFFLIFLCLFLSTLFVYLSFNVNELQRGFESRYSKVLFDRNKVVLSAFINEKEQWHLSENTVLKKLEIAVIEYEDKKFNSHFGVDFLALARAFFKNFTASKKSGASTISMQVIKLYEQNERTYLNKVSEIIKAIKLDATLSKDEILRLYLNNAPYGGNLVGFSSAILFYFDKDPLNLSWSEAALLAVLPNAPGLMNLEKNKHKLKEKRDRLLHRLFERGHFDETSLKLALAEPLPSFKPRRNLAPHLALRLLNDKQKQIISSIDKDIQVKFEQKARDFSLSLKRQGIKNLAVMLVSSKSGEVLAYLGSQDFYDEENLGQVNGVVAKRSVGSTLKPFLFALAMDEGLISLNSLMLDVPTFFSTFSPQNANKKYYGLIRAKEALQRSLNVPFVSLLQNYGYERFFYEIKDFVGFEDEDYARYGLSFILGTKEMSLEELTRLYLSLANYGEMKDLTYFVSEGENLNFNDLSLRSKEDLALNLNTKQTVKFNEGLKLGENSSLKEFETLKDLSESLNLNEGLSLKANSSELNSQGGLNLNETVNLSTKTILNESLNLNSKDTVIFNDSLHSSENSKENSSLILNEDLNPKEILNSSEHLNSNKNSNKALNFSLNSSKNLKENSKQRQFFSRGSAYLTLEALKELKRVGVEEYNQKDKIVSWKTGTSYGRKDAWALGVTPLYTLGVWVGNFTGEANANLYGVSIAGELFFELLGLLDELNLDFLPSEDLISLKIDAPTGYRYDLNVSSTHTLYPRDAKALRVSPFLKKSYEFNGRELNSLDKDFVRALPKIKLNLPPHALAFFEEAKLSLDKNKALKILYPSSNLHLVATKDLDKKNALIVRVANLKNERLFWYLNNALIYEGFDKSLALNLKSDKYELFIISQSGDSDRVSFVVE